MQEIKVATKNLLVKKLVILDGITRSGKFFLGRIIDGLKSTEHFQAVDLIEIIPYLEKLGAIREDTAISLLQIMVDQWVYNIGIGRNLNFRYNDGSSIFKYPDLGRYLLKTFSQDKDRKETVKAINKDKRISVFVTHEVLPCINIFFKSFPDFKMIHIIRHPIDIMYSWYLRGFGGREISDPLYLSPCVNINNKTIPWYAYNWSDEYIKLSRMDRIIKSIEIITEISQNAYGLLPLKHKKNILFVTYEDLIEDSWAVVKKAGLFLNTIPSESMSTILARENCNRKIDPLERKKKMLFIKKMASPKMFKLMMRLASLHEKGKLF
ncbi:MAG: sulfotransferase domain-containing protein [Candidatus Omnitrophica bacterium]|nr:sulfotransferase domain-containing protein [Candidatus Omnitrophota bacterium]MDD5352410.1 sulfotransferase domain-containing protein [Candidatus Omnitrophota bacterium]MDD5550008.1 sulfotransferase domain-containing protein [Candidatus Omnitrophota bacterium]